MLTWMSPPLRFDLPLILSPFSWWWWLISKLFGSLSLDDLMDKSISAEGIKSTSSDASFASEVPLLPSNFVGGLLRFDDIICKNEKRFFWVNHGSVFKKTSHTTVKHYNPLRLHKNLTSLLEKHHLLSSAHFLLRLLSASNKRGKTDAPFQ